MGYSFVKNNSMWKADLSGSGIYILKPSKVEDFDCNIFPLFSLTVLLKVLYAYRILPWAFYNEFYNKTITHFAA